MRCVRGRLQQVHRLHQTIKRVQGHDHGVWRIAPRNHCVISVSDDLIDHALEATPGFRKVNDSDDANLYLINLLYKFIRFFVKEQVVTKQNARKGFTQRALDLNIGLRVAYPCLPS